MGRTIATFHQLIEQTQARFAKFRRALRREDQQVFDELFARVKYYAASGSFEAAWEPLEVIFLAMLVAQQKEMRALAVRLEILENPDADRRLVARPLLGSPRDGAVGD
jgi:hypothetical protein